MFTGQSVRTIHLQTSMLVVMVVQDHASSSQGRDRKGLKHVRPKKYTKNRYPIRIPVVFDIEYRHSLRNTAKKGTIMKMISAKITLISCICAKLIRCLRLTWRTGNLHTAGESATAWSW